MRKARSRRARALLALVALLVLVALPGAGGAAAADNEPIGGPIDVHVFYLSTCPHCAAARADLAELADEVPGLVVHEYEVSSDAANQQLFASMTAARGEEPRAVPTVILGDQVWVGWSTDIAAQVRDAVLALAGDQDGGDATPAPAPARDTRVDVPFVGEVDVGGTSLLVSTLVIAFVDGVNPCSLWVLSILLALVLHSGSRGRVLLVGGTFLVITTALYGLYVAGAYSLLSYASYLDWIQRAVALLVAGFAVVNIRDAFRVGQPALLAIPAGAKPGIYRRARSLLAPDRSPVAVVAGTATLAVGVSLVETPCSAALPLLWTDLVSAQDPGLGAAGALFAVYMVVFLVDELVLFGAAVVTMRATRLQERHGRQLRLLTGTVMLGLAGAMLVDPALLADVEGTLVVLAVVAALTVVGFAIERHRSRAVAGQALGPPTPARP
jgi:glutaredoxin